MRAAKLTVSVPVETMRVIDAAAKRLKMTRSHYVAMVLERIVCNEDHACFGRCVDAVLATIEQDLETVRALAAAGLTRGTQW